MIKGLNKQLKIHDSSNIYLYYEKVTNKGHTAAHTRSVYGPASRCQHMHTHMHPCIADMGWPICRPIWCVLQCDICNIKVTEKAFHKNAKACRAGFHKKPTKQDGTHMTIRSQISIPTSIFPTTPTIIPYSLFWNGCVYLCVVNSRISLWGLWVGVCIEGSRE